MKINLLGHFFFLRFSCAAISVPESYGLVKNSPSKAARRSLVLITKVLQNLANELQFGSKESYMLKVNDFISTNIPKLSNFYKNLLTIPADYEKTDTAEITLQIKNNSLAFVYNHLIQNKTRLNDALEDNPIKKRINDIINNIGPAFEKTTKTANES